MPLKKQLLKNRKTRVAFVMPAEAVQNARNVQLVGEFNSWNIYATPLKKQKDGSFMAVLDLDSGKEYQYRYLIDETKWENDWSADKYVPTTFGDCENSVVCV